MSLGADLISDGVLKSLATAVSLYVVGVGIYLWVQAPNRSWPYVVAIVLVGLAWAIRYLKGRNRADDSASRASNRKLTQSIAVAGFLMAIPLSRQLGIG